MELDFSKLNKLSFSEHTGEKKPPETPTEPPTEASEHKPLTESEKPATGLREGIEGIISLQRQADSNKAELEMARAVYAEYQDNIKASSQLQADILKGLKRGEDIYSLFLKAANIISLMTSNKLFYNQIEADIGAIYGRGLQYKPPLQRELQEAQNRLQRLLEAEQTENTPDSRQRIRAAIKAHRAAIEKLEDMINKKQSGEPQ